MMETIACTSATLQWNMNSIIYVEWRCELYAKLDPQDL